MWDTFGERLQEVLTNLATVAGEQARTFDGSDHSRKRVSKCAVAFSAEVHLEQSEELGPSDFAGDEKEQVLDVQMSDATEQEQEIMVSLNSEKTGR